MLSGFWGAIAHEPTFIMREEPDVSREKSRLNGLDILRGLAVLLVFFRHLPIQPRSDLGRSERFLEFFFEIGWTGVDLFYVLSGFLIAGLLFKEILTDGKLNVVRFWFRRGLKIWPCYFLVYGVWVGANLWFAHRNGDSTQYAHYMETLLPNCLFYQNYGEYRLLWPAAWSIAVEEHFYLLLPLVLVALVGLAARISLPPSTWTRMALAFGLLALAIPPVLRWWTLGDSTDPFVIYLPTHLRFDSLLAGVLLRFTRDFLPSLFHRIARTARWLCPLLLLAAAGVVCLYPIARHPQLYVFVFTLNHIAFALLVALAVSSPEFGGALPVLGRVLRVLSWIGVYSYTIYLTHATIFSLPWIYLVQKVFTKWFGPADTLSYIWAYRLAYYGLSILLGYLLAICVEQPILRWRDRIWPSHARPTAPPQPVVIAKAA